MKNIFKTAKRIMAGIVALTILSAGAVFAADANALSINGQVIEDAQVINVDDKTFVPVRALCEALGMEVMWDNDAEMVTIVKLPVYVTFSPEADGYTFARTAPMLLGSAPFLKNDRTYVPVNFIDEILQQKYELSENGDINVTAEVDKSVGAIILEKTVDGENLSITVEDSKRGEEVVANITAETVIVDENGETLTTEALTEGASIKIEYAEFMTMSIPPMTNAVKIQVMGAAEDAEAAEKVVTILEKDMENNTITVFDAEKNSAVVLNIAEETVIKDKEGNTATFDALVLGTDITVVYADFMTMSIPPITNALEINIVDAKATTTVIAKDAEAKTITVFDKEMRMELVLNISDSTVITDAEGNALTFDAIGRGTELAEIEHSEAMTKSLPPITNATKLVVAK